MRAAPRLEKPKELCAARYDRLPSGALGMRAKWTNTCLVGEFLEFEVHIS